MIYSNNKAFVGLLGLILVIAIICYLGYMLYTSQYSSTVNPKDQKTILEGAKDTMKYIEQKRAEREKAAQGF